MLRCSKSQVIAYLGTGVGVGIGIDIGIGIGIGIGVVPVHFPAPSLHCPWRALGVQRNPM